MKKFMLAAAILAATATVASARGPIESACLRSDRPQATRALCSCIQNVADMTLKSGDQRKAAAFFKDPHKAQEVRVSKKSSDNAFWARYRNFGTTAEAYCAG